MSRKTLAYTGPFVTFMLFTALSGWLESAHVHFSGVDARYLIFPVQTLVCACVLAYFWPQYRLRFPRAAWLAILVAIVVFALWIAPGYLMHKDRLDGFDPGVFAGPAWWASLTLRFLRLVIVVPLLEEIFWRGFLLRFLINDEFDAVPFGTYARTANAVVAIGFMLEHSTPDYAAALVTGLLYNMVAYRTKSLSSCVLAHAVTNALLGAYIMKTHQWGYW